jgi:hypothetical protein
VVVFLIYQPTFTQVTSFLNSILLIIVFNLPLEVIKVVEEIKEKQSAAENHVEGEQSITLKEKITIVVLVGYFISLIWLVGSKYWYGIW